MWLPSCLALFTVGLAVVSQAPHMCGWSWAWAAAIPPRQLAFVIFQTGNPNASSYRTQILDEIPSRAKAWPGTGKSGLFFQVRVIAEVYRLWGIFNALPFLLEPLRVGAGLEDLQDQSVKVQPPPTIPAADRRLFLGWVVVDIHSPHLPRSELCWKQAMKLV